MKVAIIMGSNSDWPILEPAEKTLKEFGVEVEVIVASAHRTPDVVHEFAAGARNRGVEAIIAAAGAAAHYSACNRYSHQCHTFEWYGCAFKLCANACRYSCSDDGY